jgi:hypothetical protein
LRAMGSAELRTLLAPLVVVGEGIHNRWYGDVEVSWTRLVGDGWRPAFSERLVDSST